MTKDEFIEKWSPETSNSRMKEVNYKIVYDPEFESDLNALLIETAEKQREACKDEVLEHVEFGELSAKAVGTILLPPLSLIY